MDDNAYRQLQERIFELSQEISRMDIEGFLSRIITSTTVGPLIDPTLYNKAIDSLQRIEKVARSFKSLKDVVKEETLKELDSLYLKHEKTKATDLSESVVNPKICPTCKNEGMKQSRNDKTGAWLYECPEAHKWEGTH